MFTDPVIKDNDFRLHIVGIFMKKLSLNFNKIILLKKKHKMTISTSNFVPRRILGLLLLRHERS